MTEMISDMIRLEDRILYALKLSLQQDDLEVSELLVEALEQTMVRKFAKENFTERRSYPPEFDVALKKLQKLRDARA